MVYRLSLLPVDPVGWSLRFRILYVEHIPTLRFATCGCSDTLHSPSPVPRHTPVTFCLYRLLHALPVPRHTTFVLPVATAHGLPRRFALPDHTTPLPVTRTHLIYRTTLALHSFTYTHRACRRLTFHARARLPHLPRTARLPPTLPVYLSTTVTPPLRSRSHHLHAHYDFLTPVPTHYLHDLLLIRCPRCSFPLFDLTAVRSFTPRCRTAPPRCWILVGIVTVRYVAVTFLLLLLVIYGVTLRSPVWTLFVDGDYVYADPFTTAPPATYLLWA